MSDPSTIDPASLFSRLRSDGPAPRIAWRSGDGEQLELSGGVLANWAAKTANLLVVEAEAEPGRRVLLDLPVHWRGVVWTLGAWLTGATVVVGEGDGAGEGFDAVVTTQPEVWLERCDVVVAVPLPSFALRWPGDLPGAALDGSADVAAQPDALGWVAPADPDAAALVVGERAWTYAELATGRAGAEIGADDGVAGVLVAALGALGGAGVVALVG